MVSHRFGAGLPRSTFTPEDRTFIFRPLAIISPVWIDFRPTWSTRSWVSSRYSGSDFDMRDKELGLLSVFGFRPRRTCNIGNSVSRDRQRVRHRLDREDRHRRNRLDRIRDRHRWTGPDLGPGSTSASTGPLDTSPELDSGLLFSFSLRGLPITPLPRGQVRKVLKGPLRRSSPPSSRRLSGSSGFSSRLHIHRTPTITNARNTSFGTSLRIIIRQEQGCPRLLASGWVGWHSRRAGNTGAKD